MPNPGTIDNLNFEVILQDKNFSSEIKRLEEIANKFNLTMTQTLDITKKIGGNSATGIKSLSKALDSASKSATTLTDKLKKLPNKSVSTFASGIKTANMNMSAMPGLLRTISQLTGVAFGVAGLRRFLKSLIEITGQFEVQKMALGAMLQNADMADKIFNQYRKLALESPYTFLDFTKYGKQLTAFNIPATELVGTTKMLADIAAGLGVSMDRIILAYGQIKSAGVLKGTELRQLTEAGIPILDMLAKKLEEATGRSIQLAEVFDMIRRKQIPFEMVNEAFKEMTSEGGKFYNMQEVLVETLAGKIGKLRDTWQQALYDIGSSQSKLLKGGVDLITKLVSNYEQLGRTLLEIVAAYGAYKAVLSVATLAIKGYTAAEIARLSVLKATTVAQNILNATVLKNPYVLFAAGVVGAAIALERLIRAENYQIKAQKSINNTISDYAEELVSERESLRLLISRMEKLNPQTEKYAELKERLIGKYGDYLTNVDKENIAVGRLSGVYDRLALSIEGAAKQKYVLQGYDDLTNELDGLMQRITKDFKRKYRDVPGEVQLELLDYIFGNVDKDSLTEDAKEAFGYINLLTGQADQSLDRWRESYQEAVKSVEQGKEDLDRIFGKRQNGDVNGGEWPPKPQDWQKVVNKNLYGKDKSLRDLYGYKPDEDWETYYKRMAGEYDDVNERILHSFNQSDKELYEGRKAFLQQLNKEFGGTLLAGNKTTRKEATEEKRAENEEVKAIQKKISILQKYMNTYKEFEELVGADMAQTLTQAQFGNVKIADFNFISQIDEELKKLEMLGKKDVADGIRASLGLGGGKEMTSAMRKAQETVSSYKELVRTMTSEDTDIEGKGFWYDINKVASDLETKLNKLSLQGAKAKEKLAGIDVNNEYQKAAIFKSLADDGWTDREIKDFWNQWVVDGDAAIDRFIADASQKASAAARERVTELAKGYVEDAFFLNGIDFDDLSNKNLSQLKRLKEKIYDVLAGIHIEDSDRHFLEAMGIDTNKLADVDLDTFLSSEPNALDESTVKILKLMQAVQKAGGSFDDFGEVVDKVLKGKLKDVAEEEKKALIDLGKYGAECFLQISDALGELAGAMGDDGLAMLAGDFKEVSNFVSNVLNGFAKGDVAGATLAAVTSIVTGLINAVTETANLRRELAGAREEARGLRFESDLAEGVESIFGENGVRSIKNATAGIRAASDAMRELNKSMPDEFRLKKNFWKRFARGGGNIFWGLIGSQFNRYDKRSLQELADSLGRDLYDEYGNLNAQTLQAILDTYDQLASADREWIEQAITNSENYRKAMEQLDAAMEDLVGDIVSSAASAIVESWKTAGDAALDYADILDDVATRFAEMAVQSVLLDTIFNDERIAALNKQFKSDTKSGDYSKSLGIIAAAMEEANQIAPLLEEQILRPLQGYISSGGGESTDSLSSGISKELVERNSTLLASYINAIRADVSVTRQDIHTYLPMLAADVRQLIGGGGPSLSEYQVQVQTHLANIEASNASVAADMSDFLYRFKGLVTPASSGGSAIRTTR